MLSKNGSLLVVFIEVGRQRFNTLACAPFFGIAVRTLASFSFNGLSVTATVT